MSTSNRRCKQNKEERKADSTDPGGGCASQAGPACLVVGWGRGHHREHRLAPDMTLRDRKGLIKVIVTGSHHLLKYCTEAQPSGTSTAQEPDNCTISLS